MKPAPNKQIRRVIITADIHGYYSAWQKIKTAVEPQDALIIAGDLFGNRYPDYNNPDFRPEDIRAEIGDIPLLYYVYGNCDIPQFCPGYAYEESFSALGKKWFIHHGDKLFATDADIIVTGHTHIAEIRQESGRYFLNSGSPAKPRTGKPSYIIYTDKPKLALLP
jgi:putative phosphoesterase